MISEWVCDLPLPRADVADNEDADDAGRIILVVADPEPDEDPDADARIEDTEPELVGWFA